MIITDQNGIKYQLGDKLGEGGQGSVYRVKGNNRLAIKIRTTDNINEVNNKESDNLVLCDEVEYEKYSRKIRYIPPQRKSIKDYHRTTCEQSKYLAK